MSSDATMMYYDKIESSQQRAGHQNSHPERVQIRLNPEEIRILKECNKESFYYRSLPFACIAMAATHLAVKRGILKPHPKWGSALKQLGAGFAGWFAGKIAYRSTCEEKFLHLQNSSIADAIRRKRGYASENLPDASFKTDEFALGGDELSSTLSDSDYHSSFGSLNLDTDKNIQYSGFDDRERSTVDSSLDLGSEQGVPPRSVTYEELRRRNRETYERQYRSQQSSQSKQSSPPPRVWNKQDDFKTEGHTGPKNIYGDTWER